jgi:hypothetical protein
MHERKWIVDNLFYILILIGIFLLLLTWIFYIYSLPQTNIISVTAVSVIMVSILYFLCRELYVIWKKYIQLN